jgi:hypothetical protein
MIITDQVRLPLLHNQVALEVSNCPTGEVNPYLHIWLLPKKR